MTVAVDQSKAGLAATVPYVLAQAGAPVILPSSGASNATGQITLTTALPYQPSGTVGLYLPAGVITAGSQGSGAGVYQVVFSSTTVCQLAGTGIVSANGAYVQTTAADLALVTVSVPGGAMGPNGAIRESRTFSTPSNANSKTLRVQYGGTTLSGVSTAVTASTGGVITSITRNRNSPALQVTSAASSVTGASPTYSTVDSSTSQNLVYFAQLAVATDFVILEGYDIQIAPSN